jgi:hypothetical protein
MIKIPLKEPLMIGTNLWFEIIAWADKNNTKVFYNAKEIIFSDEDSYHAVVFRLKFGL